MSEPPKRRINRPLTFIDVKNRPADELEIKPLLSYQPLQLKKEMTSRTCNNTTIPTLRRTKGLKYILPDKKIERSILTDLFCSRDNGVIESKCEFLIVVAMYNESSEQFSHTLDAVAENLSYFNAAGVRPETIACVVIVDGIRPFMQTFNKQETFFKQFFDQDMIKQRFNVSDLNLCAFPGQEDHDEFAHVFCQEVILGNAEFPLKLIMCVKQFNKRKLNSHLWFFGGFCEEIQPKYVMLLDVGTRPLEGSLFYLYEAMHCDKQLAGCCGEIKPMNYDLWKIVVPAQHVEYKFAHMLDKALESVIGYITVLPGAFSAYNWEALQGDPLWEDYFKSICRPDLMDAFQSNIYLAEDRVLCLALVTKKHHKYILRYVKKSVADTDVPDTISVLMAQRRRWINGSWFALVDSVRKFRSIFRSDHNIIRKCCFSLQMIYYILSVVYTWFIVGGFCLALSITLRNFFDDRPYLADILLLLYVSVIIVIFITSLGVKPRRVEDFYKGLSFILGCYQIFTLYIVADFVGTNILSENDPKAIAITLGGSVGLLALIVILNCEIITILKGTLHYIFLIPTYVNIFFIYSICNVHDCTWGNRPDTLTAEERERLEEFEEFRTRWAILWALCNSGFAYVMNRFDEGGSMASFYFLAGIALVGLSVIVIRVFGGILYLFDECCKRSMRIDRDCLRKSYTGVHPQPHHQSEPRIESEIFDVDEKNGYKMIENEISQMDAKNAINPITELNGFDRTVSSPPQSMSVNPFQVKTEHVQEDKSDETSNNKKKSDKRDKKDKKDKRDKKDKKKNKINIKKKEGSPSDKESKARKRSRSVKSKIDPNTLSIEKDPSSIIKTTVKDYSSFDKIAEKIDDPKDEL